MMIYDGCLFAFWFGVRGRLCSQLSVFSCIVDTYVYVYVYINIYIYIYISLSLSVI